MEEKHLCIQEDRIKRIEEAAEHLNKQFVVDGFMWEMSQRIERLTVMAEKNIVPKVDSTATQVKILIFVVAGLVAIIGALVGTSAGSGL